MLRTPGMRREEREIRGARRGAARVLRRAADGLPLGPAGVQPLVREPAPARDRPGDRDEPALLLLDEPAAGMNPKETQEITELIEQLRDGGRLHDPGDRARHARRRGDLGPRHRPRPRRQDRRGLVRAGRDLPAGDRGVLGHRRDGAGNEQQRDADAPARGHQHLLRADPHPPGREPRRRTRASSSACSAATRRASRRR